MLHSLNHVILNVMELEPGHRLNLKFQAYSSKLLNLIAESPILTILNVEC